MSGDFVIDFGASATSSSARAQAIAETLSFSMVETPRQRQVRKALAEFDAGTATTYRTGLGGTQIIEDHYGRRVVVAPAGGRVASIDARTADVAIVGNRMVKNRWGPTTTLTDAQLATIKGGDLRILRPS